MIIIAHHRYFVYSLIHSFLNTNVTYCSQRKQWTFGDATTEKGVWRTSKKISCWGRDTKQIWVVLLIDWSKASANQEHYLDLAGIRVMSSDVIRRETSGGVLNCRLFSQAKIIFNTHHRLFIIYKHILKALCEGLVPIC